MKILYAIQGTGNGHLTRAADVIPILQQHGKLDLFVSGAQAEIELAHPVKYKSKGLSFYFGKNGGVDILKTYNKNSTRKIYKEIRQFPVEDYDVVINDFEPISAWACQRKKIPCIGLSHQSALLSSKVPRPKHLDPLGWWIIKNYAPTNANVGFHFKNYDHNIFTPVIRERVRFANVEEREHYTVYLPAYDDKKLLPLLRKFSGVEWHVFSKHANKKYRVDGVSVFPVNNEAFTQSMATSKGVLCGAGFETPAEAIYLEKKLLVVPMKKQYEQHFNAASLKEMGVPVLKSVKQKHLHKIEKWLDNDDRVQLKYKNVTQAAVTKAFTLLEV